MCKEGDELFWFTVSTFTARKYIPFRLFKLTALCDVNRVPASCGPSSSPNLPSRWLGPSHGPWSPQVGDAAAGWGRGGAAAPQVLPTGAWSNCWVRALSRVPCTSPEDAAPAVVLRQFLPRPPTLRTWSVIIEVSESCSQCFSCRLNNSGPIGSWDPRAELGILSGGQFPEGNWSPLTLPCPAPGITGLAPARDPGGAAGIPHVPVSAVNAASAGGR